MFGAQRVVVARMAVIAAALQNPLAANHGELGRMVTEKVGAFGLSGRSVAEAGKLMRKAAETNARSFGKMARGGLMRPSDWMHIAEVNLAAAAALAALPTAALVPIRKDVVSNDRRLRR
jgi:hypothetical protein